MESPYCEKRTNSVPLTLKCVGSSTKGANVLLFSVTFLKYLKAFKRFPDSTAVKFSNGEQGVESHIQLQQIEMCGFSRNLTERHAAGTRWSAGAWLMFSASQKQARGTGGCFGGHPMGSDLWISLGLVAQQATKVTAGPGTSPGFKPNSLSDQMV